MGSGFEFCHGSKKPKRTGPTAMSMIAEIRDDSTRRRQIAGGLFKAATGMLSNS
jgi:hypothetical protein